MTLCLMTVFDESDMSDASDLSDDCVHLHQHVSDLMPDVSYVSDDNVSDVSDDCV